MSSADADRLLLYLLLALSAVATLLVHVEFVLERLPEEFVVVLPYLLVGWATYTLTFYALGRLFSAPSDVPNMRAADVGIALFLSSVVLSGILDTAGLTVESVPIAHVVPGIGIYVGLALVGWGFGERARVIERLTGE